MKKESLRLMICALATVWGCSEAPEPIPMPEPDAAPAPDATTFPGLPDEVSLGLVADPGFMTGQGAWSFDGAEMAPEARWSADRGVVHLLQPGARVSQAVELPANGEMLGIRIVWRGTARGVLRTGLRESKLSSSSVWTYAIRCVGTLSEPTRIEVAVEQTGEGVVELDHMDVITARGCWSAYP